MLSESLAVVAVILVTAFVFVRAGRKRAALLTLPLCGVSIGYMAALLLEQLLARLFNISQEMVLVTGMLLGLVAGTLCCYLISLWMPKRAQRIYMLLGCGFLLAITVAYILPLLG